MSNDPRRTLTDGRQIYPQHREMLPEGGQQRDYVVLAKEERAKGFVRPVRRTYKHLKCGTTTTHERGGAMRPITLKPSYRNDVLSLWRREIIEVWYRCAPDIGSQGPYYGLTISGAHLAQTIYERRRSNAAPRAFPGATGGDE